MSIFNEGIKRNQGEAVRKEDSQSASYKEIREIVKHKLEWFTKYLNMGGDQERVIIGEWKVKVHQGQYCGFIEDLTLSLYKGDVCVKEFKNFKSYKRFSVAVSTFSKIIEADVNK